ncbi:DUF2750 domain-containing protein [Shewanella sp. 4_MG-2023]|uniref:DUF2750 domain-containing protein n=1 Tax=Shewanella sp. 4_MG-2023 TaxID=3062652 RepID=UPI0026E1892E|nr:DUF2750 domain-containing protein [Shewanella sp. 4_MG-2023]MDO6678264.1 DUF2750 domain-containing protein [Shewanella sp. 4_MG-2023]
MYVFQDVATTESNYQRFLKRVSEFGAVWGLKHPEGGWAVCPSNEYEDIDVYVFWSDEAYALRCAKDNWKEYKPEMITLDSFIDNWLHGMHKDDCLVGANWDANMFGKEVEPIEVAKFLVNS